MKPITESEERHILSLITSPTGLGSFLRACEVSTLVDGGVDRIIAEIEAEEAEEPEEYERWDGLS